MNAFTLVELLIVIVVISIIATMAVMGYNAVQMNSRDSARSSKATAIAEALERYYDKNNEYPSVASIAGQSLATVKTKLGLLDDQILVFPRAAANTSSLVSATPSIIRLVYTASTNDSGVNTQCQSDANGYCDAWQLQYLKEIDGSTVTLNSRRNVIAGTGGGGGGGGGGSCTYSSNSTNNSITITSSPGSYSSIFYNATGTPPYTLVNDDNGDGIFSIGGLTGSTTYYFIMNAGTCSASGTNSIQTRPGINLSASRGTYNTMSYSWSYQGSYTPPGGTTFSSQESTCNGTTSYICSVTVSTVTPSTACFGYQTHILDSNGVMGYGNVVQLGNCP